MQQGAETLHIHMPAYNTERYVGVAIDAVLADMEASGIDDFRLMIADDASTDGTPQVLAGYASHPNIDIYTNRHNLGVGGNRAMLLAETLATPILPRAVSVRENDDVSIPGASSELITSMDARGAHLVGGSMLEFYGDDMSTVRELTRPNGQELITNGLLRGHVPVWNAASAFDPRKVVELGLEYPTARYCDDLLFEGRLVLGGAIVHNTDQPAVYYRKHRDSITTGWNPSNAKWYLRAVRQLWHESPLEPTVEDRAYVAAQAMVYLGLSRQGRLYQAARGVYHKLGGSRGPEELPLDTPDVDLAA